MRALLDMWRLYREASRWTPAHDSTAACYRRFVRPGDLCFDVGANIGSRTRALRSLGARVVAVEPHPQLARVLKLAYGRDRSVQVEQCALGERAGSAILHLGNAHVLSTLSTTWIAATQHSGRLSTSDWPRLVTVPISTLDRLIEKYGRPVFVKVDVEGYESHVLAGLSSPVPTLSFEFTPEYIDDALACLDKLSVLGFRAANFSLGESMTMASPAWITLPEMRVRLEQMRDQPIDVGDVYVSSTGHSGA